MPLRGLYGDPKTVKDVLSIGCLFSSIVAELCFKYVIVDDDVKILRHFSGD